MVMNAKKFRSILGGVVKEAVEAGSPVTKEVIAGVTSRIDELKTRDDKENIDPSKEIAHLINQIYAKKKSGSTESTTTTTTSTESLAS